MLCVPLSMDTDWMDQAECRGRSLSLFFLSPNVVSRLVRKSASAARFKSSVSRWLNPTEPGVEPPAKTGLASAGKYANNVLPETSVGDRVTRFRAKTPLHLLNRGFVTGLQLNGRL